AVADRQIGEKAALLQWRTAPALPVPEKQPLELGNRRPFDAQRQITPDRRRRSLLLRVLGGLFGAVAAGNLALIVAGEVDAAENADAAIDHHDLAVIAVIRRVAFRQRVERIDRAELHEIDPSTGQAIEELRRRLVGAVGSVD